MDAPKCKICDKKHWGLCQDISAEHILSKNPKYEELRSASNKVTDASNDFIMSEWREPADEEVPVARVEIHLPKKQRWDRTAYNAYQKDLMRRKRSK